MVRDIPYFDPLTIILSQFVTAIPSGKNGKPMLPDRAAFAAHNVNCQVATPGNSASIQPSCASWPRDNVKNGKNGNVDHPGQLLSAFPHPLVSTSTFSATPSSPPSLLHEPPLPPFLRVGSRCSSPPPRPCMLG